MLNQATLVKELANHLGHPIQSHLNGVVVNEVLELLAKHSKEMTHAFPRCQTFLTIFTR